MAGDWIKMRVDLYRDPKVCVIADALMDADGELARYVTRYAACDMAVTRNVMRNAVVGALVTVWGVMRHRGKRRGESLFCRGISLAVIDDLADLPGFGEAMAAVGWAVEVDGSVEFPRFFEEFNVDPAEQKAAAAAERQRRYRERKATAAGCVTGDVTRDVTGRVTRDVTRDVTVTPREEKRREEDKDPPKPPAKPGGGGGGGESFDPVAFEDSLSVEPVEAWGEFVKAWVAAKLPGHDSPGGIQRTPNRVAAWQARLRDEEWRAAWRAAVKRAGASAACRGEDPGFLKGGLRVETFLKTKDMVVRVLEGEFDRAGDRVAAPAPRGDPRELRRKQLLAQVKIGNMTRQEAEERFGGPLDERNDNVPAAA